ncbi:hypothetical protein [Arcanobacterium hippocoleae]|uniref:Flagellar M-ring protein FliF n=1 Tax=Arcanobacterium hippocoleae TaxID=149017 RepID=A0ABU1T2I4_9ACTO|nr:hypothetical protein [Arcanobacterium hippocoleae]MDR6939075.1 hypothetical protein [Arcanobacterium hippocoleae]
MVKKHRFTIVAVILALLLSACGAKIQTELKLDTPTSGSRIIKAVIPKLDEQAAQAVTGGMAAVDASLKKHLPKELTFSGLAPEGEHTVGTFTLKFDNLDDYRKKVASLMRTKEASEVESLISVSAAGLVTGVQVQENFTSQDLLRWAVDGLVEDGVIKESDKGNLIESGETKVTINGKTYDSRGFSANIEDVNDNGVSRLLIELVEGKSELEVAVELGYRKGMKYPEAELKAYLAKAAPSAAKLVPLSGEYNGMSVKYSVDSIADAEKTLVKLLGDPSFSVKQASATDADTGSPARVIEVNLACAAVCSPDAARKEFKFTPAEGWELDGADSLNRSGKLKMTMPIRFSALDVVAKVGESGGSVTVTAKIAQEVVALAGEAIEALVNPSQAGELKSAEKDGQVIYTLTISGDSADTLNRNLQKVSQGSGYTITQDPNSGFFSNGVIFQYQNDFASVFVTEPDASVTHELTIDGYTIADSTHGNTSPIKAKTNTGEVFAVQGKATKLSIVSIVVLVVILVLLLAIGIAAYLKRELIAEHLRKWKAKRAAAAAQAQLAHPLDENLQTERNDLVQMHAGAESELAPLPHHSALSKPWAESDLI